MRRVAKWLGYLAGGLATLVLLLAAGVYGASEARYRKEWPVVAKPVTVQRDSATIARGAHVVHALGGCTSCHGDNLAGTKMIDDPAFGRIYALNLTRGKGGVGSTLSDADFDRAIRHGLAPTGRALKIMPSTDYANLSDEDLAAVIAFVRSIPPVDNELPLSTVGPVARALMVAGKIPLLEAEHIDHERLHVLSVSRTPMAGYGAYLASVSCKGCHGPKLNGGRIANGPPEWPPAANLTPAGPTKTWTEEDFRRLLREGERPDGSAVKAGLAWKHFRNMTDDEIPAIFFYLRTVQPVAT